MTNNINLHHGDCLEVLRGMPDNSVDSIVTDPPYGLSFMGKRWDYDVPSVEIWAECLRVLKPGGHLLAFAGTRTQHRMAVRIEDAGFEIRDMIAWVYGSGFPKSLDVSKAIDKMDAADEQERRRLAFTAWVRSQGVTSRQIDEATGTNMGGHYTTAASQPAIMTREHLEACRHLFRDVPEWVEREADQRTVESENFKRREVIGVQNGAMSGWDTDGGTKFVDRNITLPATEAARQWQGWGTALKPALETVTFASKPYTDEQERDIIQSNLIRLEARLWLLSFASAAEKNSTSNPSEYGAACAIAQWSADEIINTRAALCGQMDTSRFESATTTSLSIVSSWRRTLAASWNDGNTSIIETKSSTTIDWRTLKFSLSQITPASIIKACSLPGGFSVNATTAENHFNASLSLLQNILTLSATEPAISQEAESYLGAGVTPNLDPCIMARKPLIGTVAENVLAHGTGALNIDGCRVGTETRTNASKPRSDRNGFVDGFVGGTTSQMHDHGRWPANLIHDGSEEVVAGFPQAGGGFGKRGSGGQNGIYSPIDGTMETVGYGDTGSAARFFKQVSHDDEDLATAQRFMYCAKASKRDRDEGLEGFEVKRTGGMSATADGSMLTGSGNERTTTRANIHPTVKPTDLMRYLCRLVTPPGGTVLDPFMGSGSTGKAAMREGLRFVGIEREAQYMDIARARIYGAVPAACDLFSASNKPSREAA